VRWSYGNEAECQPALPHAIAAVQPLMAQLFQSAQGVETTPRHTKGTARMPQLVNCADLGLLTIKVEY